MYSHMYIQLLPQEIYTLLWCMHTIINVADIKNCVFETCSYSYHVAIGIDIDVVIYVSNVNMYFDSLNVHCSYRIISSYIYV